MRRLNVWRPSLLRPIPSHGHIVDIFCGNYNMLVSYLLPCVKCKQIWILVGARESRRNRLNEDGRRNRLARRILKIRLIFEMGNLLKFSEKNILCAVFFLNNFVRFRKTRFFPECRQRISTVSNGCV